MKRTFPSLFTHHVLIQNLIRGTIGITIALSSHPLLAQTLTLSENLISLTSEQGTLLLQESRIQADYAALSSHFVTQVNQAYCGVASMAMVLNALGVPAPETEAWDQNYFTQDNLLDTQTDEIIPASLIQRQGLTLAELEAILERYGVRVDRHHGASVTLAQFREYLVENLRQGNDYVLINYLRRSIGQERGGHISPIAAYHEESDRFLVLDVSRYKYPPVWVTAEELWQSIDTIDSVSGKTRGFLLIKAQASRQ